MEPFRAYPPDLAMVEVVVTKFSVRSFRSARLPASRAAGPCSRLPEEPGEAESVASGGASATVVVAPVGTAGSFERSSNGTRRRVIEAGARVFADLGFNAATKERIGAAAGFSHQTVRDYFRTKEALLAAIVADAWRTLLGAMTARSDARPVEQALAAYDALDELARSRPAEARCVLHEAHIAGPRGGPMQVDEERAFHLAVGDLITKATGLHGADATARAEALVAAMEGLARPHVVQVDARAHAGYSTSEARRSFKTLADSMLKPVS